MKKFGQIQYLREQIKAQQRKTAAKRSDIREKKQKVDQRMLSKTLVTAFKQCADNVVAEKQQRIQEATNDRTAKVKDLNRNDKKRILENFVENDDALGQLLDFISNQYMHSHAKGASAHAHPHPSNSMSIVDGVGNRIVTDHKARDSSKIYTRSAVAKSALKSTARVASVTTGAGAGVVPRDTASVLKSAPLSVDQSATDQQRKRIATIISGKHQNNTYQGGG